MREFGTAILMGTFLTGFWDQVATAEMIAAIKTILLQLVATFLVLLFKEYVLPAVKRWFTKLIGRQNGQEK